jgi:hypothetical protein
MWLDNDLPPGIASRIQPLCKEGDRLAEAQPELAIARYREALEILPEPKQQWLAATWILTAIGDTAYGAGDLALAQASFQGIDTFKGWHANPFIRLRRGQVAFDTGDMESAANELACAFMAGGYGILETADEKYARFVLSRLLPPVPPEDHPLARFHLTPKKPWWKPW